MTDIHSLITDLKTQLEGVGENPLPVVDGPKDFALNSQGAKSFVCVSETEMEPEKYNSERYYSEPFMIEVSIRVERVASDKINNHLIRARGVLKDIYEALGRIQVAHFEIHRGRWQRESTDSASEVVFTIECTIEATEYESCS